MNQPDRVFLQLWGPTREHLIANHQFYIAQARTRLLDQFVDDAMKADAQRHSDDWLAVLLTQRGAPKAEFAPSLTPSMSAPEPLAPQPQEPVGPVEKVGSQQGAAEVVAPKITDEWRSLRTRIREGWGTEPTFANRYVIIRVGCGTGCTGNIVGDHRTGELYPLGLGGEGYDQLQLKFDNASNRLTARWGDIETQTCITQRYRWNGTDLVEFSARETTPRVDFGCDELGE